MKEKESKSNDLLVEIANFHTPRIIKVIGVGGGGGNAVAQMYRDDIKEVRYLVTNTDAKALADNVVPSHLQLGSGLGAGGNPDIGRKYAEESVNEIIGQLDDETKMVFITAGMGGGTGTGASPIIAREARKKGILTVGIVTIPFLFERERQIDKALDGLEILAKEVDAMLVINNERLREIYPDIDIINAFRKADQTLSTAVRSITEVISMHGRVNLDFADVCMVLRDGGVAVMSSGIAEGENRVKQAIENALNSPLLNNNNIYLSSRLLMAVTTSSNEEEAIEINELDDIAEFMQRFDPDIQTKWGFSFNPSLGKKVKITILASGFGLYDHSKKEVKDTAKLGSGTFSPANIERRNHYYSHSSTKKTPRFFIFTERDLHNLQLIEEVERTPTCHRTKEILENIKNLSINN